MIVIDRDNKKITEEQLIKMKDEEIAPIAKQNIIALECLYNRYNYLLKAKSRGYYFIGADTADVTQEARIGFYKATRDYKNDRGSSFRTFADLCIRRHLISVVKTTNSRRNAALNHSISLDKQLGDGENEMKLLDLLIANKLKEPEALYIFNETQKDLERKIVARLSKLECLVFSYYIDGYSYREIALMLEKESKVIDNALHRAKKKITKLLEGASD